MTEMQSKPRLIFFQHQYDPRLPGFLSMHAREHAKCLSHFFEVTVIDQDCDYEEVCERHGAELALFESGVPFASNRKPRITNTKSCPKVPKIGLLNADSFGEGRAGFLSDMDHWGIETFFAIATTAAEYNPDIAKNLFIWPNFVDAELYHDYGQTKNIPVLFTGNSNALYPWRQQIARVVSRHYPSLMCPHPGYSPLSGTFRLMVGEAYARMLSASYFVPACGTVVREVVRKHFEIPGCRACLVTQESPSLKQAGFVDMVNCVFAEKDDVVEKLEFLFQHPERLQEVTDAGHQLIHSQHTAQKRDQILQWFRLQGALMPGTKIVQPNPFAALEIVPETASSIDRLPAEGSLLALLREGDRMLTQGEYSAAETLYLKCVNYYRFMPEPQFRLALCNLYRGNAESALAWITKPIQFTLAEYKASDPDPVEWAYFIVTLLCLGRVQDAEKRASQFPWLHHPELDRVRTIVGCIRNETEDEIAPSVARRNPRRSIHQLPARDFKEWTCELKAMLSACGQTGLAQRITRCKCSEEAVTRQRAQALPDVAERCAAYAPGMERQAAAEFKRRLRYEQLQAALKRPIKSLLYRLENYRDFLPASLARYRKDGVCEAIRDRASAETFRTALVIGAEPDAMSTKALLDASRANGCRASVFGVGVSNHRSEPPTKQGFTSWHQLRPSSPELLANELDRITTEIRETHQIDCFDMLIIDGSQLDSRLDDTAVLLRQLDGAQCAVLEGINCAVNHVTYSTLLDDPRFVLVDFDLSQRNGYALFERRDNLQVCDKLPALAPAVCFDDEAIQG